ncbi:hypothetical protein G6F50_016464 [Rhizopus delemar]|uniref:PNPLA domain-containing protein n=1 Tax=Rhizopus delemar TaxID=936053 RepID=A0A9P7C1N3_9FUNG|nr:hypothetical protein G6F50_016464 [Rhizopus delemar]
MTTRRKSQSTDTGDTPPYETVALVLQGGGALGSYQAGVYQGLHEAGIRPNWISGISIGSINAAIIAASAVRRGSPRCRGATPWRACSKAFPSDSVRPP